MRAHDRGRSSARARRGHRLRGGAARGRAPLRHRQAEDGSERRLRARRHGREAGAGEAPSNLAVAARYVFAGDLRRRSQDTRAGQGRRDPAHRRDPRPDPAGRPGARHAAGGGRAPLRHRQLRELLPRLRRVRPGRPAARPLAAPVCAGSTLERRPERDAKAERQPHADHPQARATPAPAWSATRPTATTARRSRSSSATSAPRSCCTSGTTSRSSCRPDDAPLRSRSTTWPATSSCTATTAACGWSRRRSRSSSSTAAAQGIALHDRNFSIRYRATIPRQVGLAGSSAIIVATLRCLMEFYGVDDPARGAAVAGALGRERGAGHRGRPAGPRDPGLRGAGLHGLRASSMPRGRPACACYHYEPLDPALLPPLYIAYQHGRERADGGVPQRHPRPLQPRRPEGDCGDAAGGRPRRRARGRRSSIADARICRG